MKKLWVRTFVFGLIAALLFLLLFSVDVFEAEEYQKLRIVNKAATDGLVIRMKPEGWELWKLENKVETGEIFAKEMDFVAQYLTHRKKTAA